MSQGLGGGPDGEEDNQNAGVLARTRKADHTLVMRFPSGLLADGAPIITAVLGVHAIAKETGDDDSKGFNFGQAPLGGPVPAFPDALLVLVHASDALDLSADQSGQCLGGHKGGKQGDNGHARRAFK